ncbi:hypothetical protein QAD02_006072 [Eretmocerus hayati]|uniref:Uncharacterized protein n=1 Tax=Eretmocerus hayati TaxID=131215 RepID=A0ACC2N3Z3_9HYME|nr:hypothetical protein QAD02_006072 [Eretmocerus hayati]
MPVQKSVGTGRRRKKDAENWGANKRKRLRNKVLHLVYSFARSSNSRAWSINQSQKKLVTAKLFQPVEYCCPAKCHIQVHSSEQGNFFDYFYKHAGPYDEQDLILKGLMTRKSAELSEIQRIGWTYRFNSGSLNVVVCQKFLCSLPKLKIGRFATLQNRMKSGGNVKDERRKHTNRKIKLDVDLKEMIKKHCESIPHHKSHYTKSSLEYFEDSDLTSTSLYNSFCAYYSEQTGLSDTPLDKTTYEKYFNSNLNYSFTQPRTDVCDDCSEFKSKGQTVELESHMIRVAKHRQHKDLMLNDDVICIEIDFGQNLPVPKIPVTEQFYKRLLWINVFNVNILEGSTKNSYMYLFLEGTIKKGGNTVCNLLLDAMEEIESPEEYYQLIQGAKTPPSIVIKNSENLVRYFEPSIDKECVVPKNVHIQESVKIVYFPNGTINVFHDYEALSRKFLIESSITIDDLLKTPLAPPVGISAEMGQGVMALLRYSDPEPAKSLAKFLDSVVIKKKNLLRQKSRRKGKKVLK